MPEDLFALAEDVMLHRMRLRYEAIADGLTGRAVVDELLRALAADLPLRDLALLADPESALRPLLSAWQAADANQANSAAK